MTGENRNRTNILQVENIDVIHGNKPVIGLADPSLGCRTGLDQNVAILAAVGSEETDQAPVLPHQRPDQHDAALAATDQNQQTPAFRLGNIAPCSPKPLKSLEEMRHGGTRKQRLPAFAQCRKRRGIVDYLENETRVPTVGQVALVRQRQISGSAAR
jgi:hypothetical protein